MDQASTTRWQEHARRFLSVFLVATVACAHSRMPYSGASAIDGIAPSDGNASARALILRTLWLPDAPTDAQEVDREVLRRWGNLKSLEPLPFTDRVEPGCAEDVLCLQELGRAVSADKVVVYRVGRLGPTTIVRAQSVDVADAAMEQTVQSILEDGEGTARDALLSLTEQLAEFYEPPTPWYRRPWVWVATGAVLVAGTLGLLLLNNDDEPDPDLVITPP